MWRTISNIYEKACGFPILIMKYPNLNMWFTSHMLLEKHLKTVILLFTTRWRYCLTTVPQQSTSTPPESTLTSFLYRLAVGHWYIDIHWYISGNTRYFCVVVAFNRKERELCWSQKTHTDNITGYSFESELRYFIWDRHWITIVT